jgi:hypothetical protein
MLLQNSPATGTKTGAWPFAEYSRALPKRRDLKTAFVKPDKTKNIYGADRDH